MTKTILIIPAEIEIKTGLHIGGSDQEFEIGWIDNPVIMKPCLDCENQEQEPYIPWSSIKWRMRALLEMYEYGIGGSSKEIDKDFKNLIKVIFEDWKLKKVNTQDSSQINNQKGFYIDKYWLIQDKDNSVSQLFWASWKDENNQSFHIPWTLIVKDFVLQSEYFEKYKNWELILEEKMENTVPRFIDQNTNPRRIQRVPAGTRFVGLFVIIGEEEQQNWQNTNNEITLEQKFKLFKRWIKLIESTYLGWSWTRGYGSVRFKFYKPEFSKSQDNNWAKNNSNCKNLHNETNWKASIEEILQAVYDSRDLSCFWEVNLDKIEIKDFIISTKSNGSETSE